MFKGDKLGNSYKYRFRYIEEKLGRKLKDLNMV